VKLLLDTHVLLWAAGEPHKLSTKARQLLDASENTLVFSVASLWEIAIKRSLGREDFRVDLHVLRRGLLDNAYEELGIASAHALAVDKLPPLHKDPFDRMLIAQAEVEGIVLVTSDARVVKYPGAIQKV
jgi:PIN domain nuclease of toxin-antitoxin system